MIRDDRVHDNFVAALRRAALRRSLHRGERGFAFPRQHFCPAPAMTWTRCFRLLPGWLAVSLAFPMSAADPSLHPLHQPVGPGEIQFTLRGAAEAGESLGVECVYRPHRERDVKKSRHLNLLRGWIGGGSRDLIKVQREEFHSVRQQSRASGTNLQFTATLRDPAEGYDAYQLETVRLVGRLTGTLEFDRWFASVPVLDAGFGFQCEATSLRGVLRPGGLGAQPLRGSIPLWPTLRTVDLVFAPVEVPVLQLFEATAKHHWDGWRQTTPESWPGGQTTVLRHTGQPTVWRLHEYHAFPPAAESPIAQPAPPPGVMPGVHVEVSWPEGGFLEFPETRLGGEARVLALPLAKVTSRITARLAESVRLRPGWEMSSIPATAWEELDADVAEVEMPLSVAMADKGDGATVLRIGRHAGWNEPWLLVLGIPFDEGRRFVVKSLLVRPERWSGPLPE